MSFKFVLSKDTFNAITETDPNNLIYSSDFDTLKYFVTGGIDLELVNAPPGLHQVTIEHNLGYIPFFTASVNNFPYADQYISCPGLMADFYMNPSPPPDYYSFFGDVNVIADATKLYFYYYYENNYPGTVVTITFNFRYKIYTNDISV